MKKEISKEPAKPRKTFVNVLAKYNAAFSIELRSGFAHINFNPDGDMYVEWLNEEGYSYEEGHQVPIQDIERVADLMRELKELRLNDYQTP